MINLIVVTGSYKLIEFGENFICVHWSLLFYWQSSKHILNFAIQKSLLWAYEIFFRRQLTSVLWLLLVLE